MHSLKRGFGDLRKVNECCRGIKKRPLRELKGVEEDIERVEVWYNDSLRARVTQVDLSTRMENISQHLHNFLSI